MAATASKPPQFDEVLGHEAALGTLQRALDSGHIHHAWIFSGPAGVGKRTVAEAFAALLLDPTARRDARGCWSTDPASPARRYLAAGTHPDLHIITKELASYHEDSQVRNLKQTTISKAVIEQHLLTPIALGPQLMTGSRVGKVFIVDEAEKLDRSRWHAPTQASLLKTLEEPPADSVIILVTSSEDRLMPTVRSRCQRVRFEALSADEMATWFDRAQLGVTGAERAWLEAFAAGSPGRALVAHGTGLYAWHTALSPLLESAEKGRFEPSLGGAMHSLVEEWAKDSVKRGEKEGFEPSKEAANREAAGHMFGLLAERARATLRTAAGRDGAAVSRVVRRIASISEAERRLAANVNGQMVFEGLSADLSRVEGDALVP